VCASEPTKALFWGGKWGDFEKLPYGSKTSDITSQWFGEMFEGDIYNISVRVDGVRAECLASTEPERGQPSA
jgi:hypothetical protein